VAATLRGRFVEAEEAAGAEETTGFHLEDVIIVEADPEESESIGGFDPEGQTINLDMPSAVSAEHWAGKEVVVEGHFEEAFAEEEATRRVFTVESIDEA
jgi:hypothetical protein